MRLDVAEAALTAARPAAQREGDPSHRTDGSEVEIQNWVPCAREQPHKIIAGHFFQKDAGPSLAAEIVPPAETLHSSRSDFTASVRA